LRRERQYRPRAYAGTAVAFLVTDTSVLRWWIEMTRQRKEIPIRTLSVSLLAVAAIAASVLLTRSRDEKASDIPAGEQQPAEHSLDAIRAAGL
jgi:hypothetical protein